MFYTEHRFDRIMVIFRNIDAYTQVLFFAWFLLGFGYLQNETLPNRAAGYLL